MFSLIGFVYIEIVVNLIVHGELKFFFSSRDTNPKVATKNAGCETIK